MPMQRGGRTYALAFALGIVCVLAWNPGASGFGNIWVAPKFAAFMLLLGYCYFLIRSTNSAGLSILIRQPVVKATLSLVCLVVAVGIVSTLRSPWTISSLYGTNGSSDGLLQWTATLLAIPAGALLIVTNSRAARALASGFVAGACLVVLVVVVQTFDWRVDFTATSGRAFSSPANQLLSLVMRDQMPIGLYWHRGHAGFVMAFAASLAHAMGLESWWTRRISLPVATLLVAGTALSATRAPWLALGCAIAAALMIDVVRRRSTLARWVPVFVSVGLGVLVAVGVHGLATAPKSHNLAAQRSISYATVEAATSGRVELWRHALRLIQARPALGWGFHSFGPSWSLGGNLGDSESPTGSTTRTEAITFGWSSYQTQEPNGDVRSARIPSNRAHNMWLDWAVQLGVVGCVLVALLMALLLWAGLRQPNALLVAPIVAYLVYGLFWYDSPQYTPMVYLLLGFALGLRLRHTSSRTSPERPASL